MNKAIAVAKLSEAKALVEKGWVQGMPWADKKGNLVTRSEVACKFCLTGALDMVAPELNDYCFLRNILKKIVGKNDLEIWNDTSCRTKKEVLDAYDKAIKFAETLT